MNNQVNEGVKVNQSSDTSAYYTVQEFAELAGVSKQAVYERIKRDLQGYTTKKAGKTMISGDALQFVGNKEDSSSLMFDLDNQSSQDEQLEQVENQEGQSSKAVEYLNSKEGLLEYLQSDIERLRMDIDRLHGEIDRLNGVIADKDAKIAEFAERFAGLAEKEQEISSCALATTGQAQMLHAMSEQPEVIDAPQDPQEAEKKRPWWRRKGK